MPHFLLNSVQIDKYMVDQEDIVYALEHVLYARNLILFQKLFSRRCLILYRASLLLVYSLLCFEKNFCRLTSKRKKEKKKKKEVCITCQIIRLIEGALIISSYCLVLCLQELDYLKNPLSIDWIHLCMTAYLQLNSNLYYSSQISVKLVFKWFSYNFFTIYIV